MRDQAFLFHQRIVRPVANALTSSNGWLELTLTGVALAQGFSGWHLDPERHGVYGMTREQHRQVWDDFLAFRPELASQVRGFASQRQFLNDPDLELSSNLSYATAVALALLLRHQAHWPHRAEPEGMTMLWTRATNQPNNPKLHQAYRQLLDWLPSTQAA